MEDVVRDAVFGNVGTLIAFRVGAEDGEHLEKEFFPEFTQQDLVNLPKYNIYTKLMVDGVAGRPFSALTLEPIERPAVVYTPQVIKFSREKYSTERAVIEERIAKWTGDFVKQEVPKSGAGMKELFDVQCQKCNKWTKVPFKPDPTRPVYCKACLKKMEKEKEDAAGVRDKEEQEDVNSFSLEELLLKKPVSFTGRKANQNAGNDGKGVDKNEPKKALTASSDKKPDRNTPDTAAGGPARHASQLTGDAGRQTDATAVEESIKSADNVVKSGKLAPGEAVKF